MRVAAFLLCTVVTVLTAHARFGPTEKRVSTILRATTKVGNLVIHYRPSAWMKRIIPGFAKDQGRAVGELEKRLAMKYKGPIHIFVYLDSGELSRLTGMDGAGAFSAGRVIHTPFSTYPHHELTHVLCLQWNEPHNKAVKRDKKATDYNRPEYRFIVEGLADAMTELGTDFIPIKEWVAFHHRMGAVPPLEKLITSFPRTGTSASGYWIAGCFFQFLIERYGMTKVKRYYFDPAAMQAIFDKGLAGLEADWLTWLEMTPIDYGKVARSLGGEAVEFQKHLVGSKGPARINITADDMFILLHNDKVITSGHSWTELKKVTVKMTGRDELRVIVFNTGGAGGLLLEIAGPGDGDPIARSDDTWSASRGRRKGRTRVLGKPISGPWGHFADSKTRKALAAVRGSWIWYQ